MFFTHNIKVRYTLYSCMTPAEFTTIAQSLRPRLLALACSFCNETESAEDAVQEAMMRLWVAWSGLPSTADAERLAVRLTKHACIDWQRRQHTGLMMSMETAHTTETVGEESAAFQLHEREVREAIGRAVMRLRPSERRLWKMFAEAQMETAQIAASTGIDARTTSSMLSTAKRKIMNELKKGGIL